jgi:peptidyl-prolyl cis-trans isomerase B (cyclophilin B)
MLKKLTFCIGLAILFIYGKSQYEYPDIVIETNKGTIKIMLYDNTFQHSENFLKLVNEGFYNNQLFHRVIADFMIQSGDDKSKNAAPNVMLGRGGKNYTVPSEFFPEYYHKKGALAAARQGDRVNPEKRSSGSQFYLVQGKVLDTLTLNRMEQSRMHPPFTEEQVIEYTTNGGTPHLDYQYTVFGQTYEGIDVIEKISNVSVNNHDRPLEDILILKAYSIKNNRKKK